MTKPTEDMIKYCENISKKLRINLPQDYKTSFRAAREYLDKHSSRYLGYGEEKSCNSMLNSNQDNKELEETAGDMIVQFIKGFSLLLFSGGLLILVSISIPIPSIAGLFLLFGTLLVFCAVALVLFKIPAIGMVVVSQCFAYIRKKL